MKYDFKNKADLVSAMLTSHHFDSEKSIFSIISINLFQLMEFLKKLWIYLIIMIKSTM